MGRILYSAALLQTGDREIWRRVMRFAAEACLAGHVSNLARQQLFVAAWYCWYDLEIHDTRLLQSMLAEIRPAAAAGGGFVELPQEGGIAGGGSPVANVPTQSGLHTQVRAVVEAVAVPSVRHPEVQIYE